MATSNPLTIAFNNKFNNYILSNSLALCEIDNLNVVVQMNKCTSIVKSVFGDTYFLNCLIIVSTSDDFDIDLNLLMTKNPTHRP